MSMGAVVLLSGGLDSTVAMYDTLGQECYGEVHALSFDYGQRHKDELKAAKQIADVVGMSAHVVITLPEFPVWSALTHGGDLGAKTSRNPKLPASFVPGRNLLFITLAAQYAYQHGLDTVVIGANQIDYSGYPDCRGEFLCDAQRVVRAGFEWPEFEVVAPLLDMTKAQIWAAADALGILELAAVKTLSCYAAGTTEHPWGRGCGDCPSCEIRAAGWYAFQRARLCPVPFATREP